MTWMLTWKNASGPTPVDGSVLRPDQLGGLEHDAVCKTLMTIGRVTRPLGELFDITGEPCAGDPHQHELCLANLPRLDRLGAGMERGKLLITGDVGDDLGASMTGGLIRVNGNVGSRVGGPDFDSPRGMTGGEIVISGNAEHHVGHLMRRGMIIVGGTCGKSPGFRMLAGTIVIACGPLDHPGLEMQRGTVICLDGIGAESNGDHLCDAGSIAATAMPAIGMSVRRATHLLSSSSKVSYEGEACLWHGDRFELNKGEVIQWP